MANQSDKLPWPGMTRGFSFIEVLIAVLILGIGLLGVASLQVVGLQNNQGAYAQSQATTLAYQITDAMRANRQAAVAGHYNLAMGDDAPTGNSVAVQDLQDWVANVRQLLPDGQGAIRVTGGGEVRVRIRWLDDRTREDEAERRRTYEYATEI
ncbi:type IV pilus modification protein PilV [Natronospira bacteriovora]|uniref:Type IV pilus modification protein PilV n=1 Tax=Natronospira bacteriovora TaxID=3069753 RepID=A0ABU0W728_9GAMM|nr:type IV pilus modification protein PilV [Natronospira sp. AB-CW4]MDQ2068805.1 type IV pilus modification protein PilV [Natronospira sp. AB-CW4]